MLNRSLCAVAVIVAAVAAFAAFNAQAAAPSPLEGKPAPDIALTTLDGKEVKLSDQKGKVVLVDFWATWCPPCRESLPHVQELSADKAAAEKGLVVWAVNARETKDKIEAFVKQNNYTFSVPMDAKGAAMKEYGVRGIPTTVVVGRDGTVKKVFVGFGQGSAKQIDEAVKSALDEKK